MQNIRIILVETTHPGNIGGVARAMKNMGLSRLYLVAPRVFPSVDATARAAGADDILAKAVVVDTLDEALAGCALVAGTSARIRSLSIPMLNVRQFAEQARAEPAQNEIAVVFGRESSGLNNEELQRCNFHVHIPTVDNFSSLNLAAAVQIIAYELSVAQVDAMAPLAKSDDELATADAMKLFYEHLQQVLIDVDFIRLGQHKKMMARLQRLFNRTRLEKTEINILRGILTNIEQKIPHKEK